MAYLLYTLLATWLYKNKTMKETEKQLDYIRFIEEETGIKYNGNTKEEASKYISENKDKIPVSSSISMWAFIKGY